MLIHGWKSCRLMIVTGLLTVTSANAGIAAETTSDAGVIRISDSQQSDVSSASFTMEPVAEPIPESAPVDGPVVYGSPVNCEPRSALGRWWHEQSVRYATRNTIQSAAMNGYWADQQCQYDWRTLQNNATLAAHIRCKFGYFIPTGCCGKGCPPIGSYRMVYAADPNYFDARDGQVYATQATGTPTAVPLAPNVNYTYNYGWGIPSSRLTPISRTVPPQHP